jgi:hypothetical protein
LEQTGVFCFFYKWICRGTGFSGIFVMYQLQNVGVDFQNQQKMFQNMQNLSVPCIWAILFVENCVTLRD